MALVKPRDLSGSYDIRTQMEGVDENFDPEEGYYMKDDADDEEEGVCGFGEPLRASWFFTITGAEYCHVYFWILKDLSWTQELRYVSLFFGTLATLWCVVIFYHAFRTGNKDEVYNTCALFMWIFANYWWMTGEVHDADYPEEPEIYDQRASESARILECALALLTVYYFAIIPFNLMPSSPEALAAYDDGIFKSRFSWLKTFRQYENLHMYFWLAKDLAWNRNNIVMWFVLLGPAVFLAGDFFFISAFCKNSIVDTVHYATIFLWVLGNATWALGEFFLPDYDDPIRIWHGSMEAYRTARWYSSWILVTSLIPVVLLYCVWVPLTLSGRLDGLDVEPTIDKAVTRPRSQSGIEVATTMLQSLLPPLADETEGGYLSVAAHSRLASRRRVAVSNHFNPNRFNHPSPFIGSGQSAGDRRRDRERDRETNRDSSRGRDRGDRDRGERDRDRESERERSVKEKRTKTREKKAKSKTHGIAKSKGNKDKDGAGGSNRPRSKSESELADHLYGAGGGAGGGSGRHVPELESDESSTSEEDMEPVYAVAHASPFSSPSFVGNGLRVTIAEPPTIPPRASPVSPLYGENIGVVAGSTTTATAATATAESTEADRDADAEETNEYSSLISRN